jgi:hypothetical protein
MTSRIYGPHTTCPSCREEVYLDELVGGRCPLCGCSLEEQGDEEGDFEEFIERSDLSWLIFQYFLFRKLDRLGAHPARIMQVLARYEDAISEGHPTGGITTFDIEIPMRAFDRIRPKRCRTCTGIFLRGGRRMVSGDLKAPAFKKYYLCPACAGGMNH